MATLQASFETAEQRATASDESLEQAREQLAHKDEALAAATTDAGRAMAELETARAELETSQAELEANRAELDVARSQLTTATDSLNSVRTELDGLKDAEEERARLEQARAEDRERNRQAEELMAAARARADEAELKVDGLAAEHASALEVVKDLQSQLDTVTAERDSTIASTASVADEVFGPDGATGSRRSDLEAARTETRLLEDRGIGDARADRGRTAGGPARTPGG